MMLYPFGVAIAVFLAMTVCAHSSTAPNCMQPTPAESGNTSWPNIGPSITETSAESSSYYASCAFTETLTQTITTCDCTPSPSSEESCPDAPCDRDMYLFVSLVTVGSALVLIILLLLIVIWFLAVKLKRRHGRDQSKNKLQDSAVQGDNTESAGPQSIQNLSNPIYEQNADEEEMKKFLVPIPAPNTTTDAKGLGDSVSYDTVCDTMEVSDNLRYCKDATGKPTLQVQADVEVEDDPDYDYVSSKTCKSMLKAHEALSSTENVSGEYSELMAEESQEGNQNLPQTMVNTKAEPEYYSEPIKRIRMTEGLERASRNHQSNRHSMPPPMDNGYSHLYCSYEGKNGGDNPRAAASRVSQDTDAVYSRLSEEESIPQRYRKKPQVRPRPASAVLHAQSGGVYHHGKAPKTVPPLKPSMMGKEESLYDDVSSVFLAKKSCPVEEVLYDDPVELKQVLHSKDTDTDVQ